jgi:hypothetical protein
MSLTSYDDLDDAVKKHGDILSCDMGTLRDIHGAGKLGTHVVANISDELERRGLGHHPTELPVNQWENVKVYRRGSPIGNFIRALNSFESKDDALLRSIGGKNSSAEIVKKIRELVCD